MLPFSSTIKLQIQLLDIKSFLLLINFYLVNVYLETNSFKVIKVGSTGKFMNIYLVQQYLKVLNRLTNKLFSSSLNHTMQDT